MPHDRVTVPDQKPVPIKIPDQLQQAKRSDVPRKSESPVGRDEPKGGILYELRTDRAHD